MSKPVWEIEPHYCSDFDVLDVDDLDAWDQLIQVVEHVYDNMEAGEERTITIRFNGPRPDKETAVATQDDTPHHLLKQGYRSGALPDMPTVCPHCHYRHGAHAGTCPTMNRGGSR